MKNMVNPKVVCLDCPNTSGASPRIGAVLVLALGLFAAAGADAQDEATPAPPPQEPAPAEAPVSPEAAAPVETAPAPLVQAKNDRAWIVYQMGAAAGGLGMGGADGVFGFNHAFNFPVWQRLWIGIRPALHYVMPGGAGFDAAWLNADVDAQVNIAFEPVRIYGLLSGGYAFACDPDLFGGLAHGWSVSAAIGAAWVPGGSGSGLFAELGFLLGRAGRSQTVLARDAQGQPIPGPDGLTWETVETTRRFELTTVFLNVGVVYQP